jgi:hypothetical protein
MDERNSALFEDFNGLAAAVAVAMRRGGSRRISQSCRSCCESRSSTT